MIRRRQIDWKKTIADHHGQHPRLAAGEEPGREEARDGKAQQRKQQQHESRVVHFLLSFRTLRVSSYRKLNSNRRRWETFKPNSRLSNQIQCLDAKVDSLAGEVNTVRKRVKELVKTAGFYPGELDSLRDALRNEQRERGSFTRGKVLLQRHIGCSLGYCMDSYSVGMDITEMDSQVNE
uniref:Uncharacterized protein n=1 Tax=Branchiostoma floridae TaxID=7739 RepID=C3YY48_BRAFL|eukprot:XP_002598995.1 hypothetical protein BRAFLDRAFT_79929 [Branchiostoma floridae]